MAESNVVLSLNPSWTFFHNPRDHHSWGLSISDSSHFRLNNVADFELKTVHRFLSGVGRLHGAALD